MPALNMNQWLKANPRNSRYGAPLGTRDDPLDEEVPVHVERLKLVDGGYLLDGTYYGSSPTHGDVYAVWQDAGSLRRAAYIRARTRKQALDEVASRGLTALRPY